MERFFAVIANGTLMTSGSSPESALERYRQIAGDMYAGVVDHTGERALSEVSLVTITHRLHQVKDPTAVGWAFNENLNAYDLLPF